MLRSSTRCEWAHPRSRGEHQAFYGLDKAAWGSSPLARGTLLASCLWFTVIGLIPARAGNTYERERYR